jgi:hypothetical protein
VQPEYNLVWIFPYVRESLRDRGNMNFDSYVDALFGVLERVNVPTIQRWPYPNSSGTTYNYDAANPNIREATTEAFYYLERQGFIVRPAPTHHGAFVGHGIYRITCRGREWAKGVEPLPEDYNGYIRTLSELVPNFDGTIREYVSEGLVSFGHGTYFAAAVMVGAASEKAIYLLAESMLESFKDVAQQAKLKKLLGERSVNRLLSFVEKTILDAHDGGIIPYSVMEGTTRHLMSLLESIRVQRNDAVHPTNGQVSADSVRLSFSSFPHALEKVEALRSWFVANPKSI